MIGQFFKSFIPGKTADAGTSASKFVVPSTLPQVPAQTAGPIMKSAGLSGPVELMEATPSKYLEHVLNAQPDGPAATQFLAHGMKPESGLNWATTSADAVAKHLSPADAEALAAAKAFQAAPTAINREEARTLAQKSGYNGPGAWAALAAAAYPIKTDTTRAASAATPAPDVFPKAVAGAVTMASIVASKKPSPAAAANVPAAAPHSVMAVATTIPPPAAGPIAGAAKVSAPDAGSAAAALTGTRSSGAPSANQVSAADKAALAAQMKPFIDRGLQIASLS